MGMLRGFPRTSFIRVDGEDVNAEPLRKHALGFVAWLRSWLCTVCSGLCSWL